MIRYVSKHLPHQRISQVTRINESPTPSVPHESLDSRASHEPNPSHACTSTFSSHVKFTCQKESRRRSAVLKLYLQVKCYIPPHKVRRRLYQILGVIVLKAMKFNEMPCIFILRVISKYVKLHNAFSEDSYVLCYYISR